MAATAVLLVALIGALFFREASSDCITSYSSSENYFPDSYSPSGPFQLPVTETVIGKAEKFSIQYNNAYKLIFNSFSNTSYLLYQCGAPVSSDYNATVKPIEVPVGSVAIDSTVPIGYLELLGLLPILNAVSQDYTSPYINSPCVQKLLEQGAIKQLNSSSSDFEEFNGLVFTALQGFPKYNSSFVYFDASQDPGPLKRAEWIKYLASFFNMEKNATEIYSKIEVNYQCLNGSSSLSQKPVVAWVSEYPEGVIGISNAGYKTQLTLDAGGSNLDSSLYRDYNLSSPAERAALNAVLKTVDILIDEIYTMNPMTYNISTLMGKLMITEAAGYPFLTNKRVWREDRRIQKTSFGLDWYEGSLPQPQVVLQELLGILDPSRNHQHFYFRNIAEAEGLVELSSADCTAADPTSALEPTIFACPVRASDTTSSTPSTFTSGASTNGQIGLTALIALALSLLLLA